MKKVVFIDLDGVLAVWPAPLNVDPPEALEPGFFRNLPVMDFAKEGVAQLLALSYLKVYIGSKISSQNSLSATEKLEWLREHFPALAQRAALVYDKSLLHGDYLIDDNRKWKQKFSGKFIYFDSATPEQNWTEIVNFFTGLKCKFDAPKKIPKP
jgi:hypothetical protein